ncbi:hypothetical protein N5J06_19950 [Ralstonia sp. CHL-2022]|uniref:Uncharacterized protein n=1 Tax=Ralstonia mojiangensis TaxID=2953895 RepID=A0ABT2LEY0_9RALS|nr:hypothetical protein [Ralstonia mojiangensis]MCT7313253.1 hypothetical protein [Ralstonia mojiangensis]
MANLLPTRRRDGGQRSDLRSQDEGQLILGGFYYVLDELATVLQQGTCIYLSLAFLACGFSLKYI